MEFWCEGLEGALAALQHNLRQLSNELIQLRQQLAEA